MEKQATISLDTLNAHAQERFKEIRARVLQERTTESLLKFVEIAGKPEAFSTINSADAVTTQAIAEKVSKEREQVDGMLNFITSMGLPNTLSLAVGYMFAFSETKDKSFLSKAVAEINREVDTVDGTD